MRKSGLPVPAAALLCGFVAAAAAQEPARDSVFLPLQPALSTNSLDRAQTTSPSRSVADATSVSLAGNPLWAIALGELSETQSRPLFSPSRRPPAPPVLAALTAAPVRLAPPAKSGPDHPLLTLLGTIVGESVEIGVFTDEASHDVVRLKAGEAHDGWTLRAIVGRSATFEKEGFRANTLMLPAPSAEAATASGGNGRIRFAPPVSNFIPVNKEGGSRRPPKEG
jgi:general secretion pathway protein N